jgi:hypothetical protein
MSCLLLVRHIERKKRKNIYSESYYNRIGVGLDSRTESLHYKQLFKKIICSNVCFNVSPGSETDEQIVGASSVDLIVDEHMEKGERLVVAIQYVHKFATPKTFIGILMIGIKRENRWYAINQSVLNRKRGTVQSFFYYFTRKGFQFDV